MRDKKKNKLSGYETSFDQSSNESTYDDINERLEQEKAAEAKEFRKFVGFFKKLALVCVLIALFSSCVVITKQNEYSVIKQFGNIVRIEDKAGISFRIPIIQSDTKVSREVLFYDIAPSDVITSDKKSMIADAYVLWKVIDAEKYTRTLGASNTNAEARLNTVVYNAIKNTISSMSQNEVILSRDGKVVVSDMNIEEITNNLEVDDDPTDNVVKIRSLTDEIKLNIADCSDYGIEIVKAEIKVLDLPDSNKESVYQRMISERGNVAASYEAQGNSEAQMIRNTTDKEVAIMKAEAEAKAESIIASGEAEYMKILSDAYNDESKSEFYSFVRSLDTTKESLTNGNNTLILDKDSPLAQLFYGK